MYYSDLFNPNYINREQYNKLLEQKSYIDKMIEYDRKQKEEIEKMAKALNDYLDAAEKISPQYQTEAFNRCAFEISTRIFKNKSGV